MNERFWVLLGAVLLVSCGGPADEVAVEQYEDEDAYYEEDDSYADEDADEGVFDPMVGTIDRAKGVEGAGADRKSQMDEAIDGSE